MAIEYELRSKNLERLMERARLLKMYVWGVEYKNLSWTGRSTVQVYFDS